MQPICLHRLSLFFHATLPPCQVPESTDVGSRDRGPVGHPQLSNREMNITNRHVGDRIAKMHKMWFIDCAPLLWFYLFYDNIRRVMHFHQDRKTTTKRYVLSPGANYVGFRVSPSKSFMELINGMSSANILRCQGDLVVTRTSNDSCLG